MRYTPRESVILEEVDGSAVLLDLDHDRFYSLNPVGVLIWNAASSHHEVGQIVDQIVTVYDVSPETAREDVVRLLDELEERGLLRAT